MTHKLPKLTPCTTSTQKSHQGRIRKGKQWSSRGNLITRVQRIQHQVSAREILTPKLCTSTKIDAPKCGDSAHLVGFQCLAKKFQCKACHKFGQFTSLCYQINQQKQVSHRSRKPKAHQLKAGALYVQENSISGQSEDPLCLQIKIQHTKASIKNFPNPAHWIANLVYHLITSQEEPVLEVKIRHLHSCKHHAC